MLIAKRRALVTQLGNISNSIAPRFDYVSHFVSRSFWSGRKITTENLEFNINAIVGYVLPYYNTNVHIHDKIYDQENQLFFLRLAKCV